MSKRIKPVTRVVSYPSHINQWENLPPRWISDCGRYEVLMMQERLRWWVQDNQVICNADLIMMTDTDLPRDIELRELPYCEELFPGTRVFRRDHKMLQQLRLSKAARALGLKNYVHVKTFEANNTVKDNSYWGEMPDGMYVIKPGDGARGMGHVVAKVGEGGVLPAALALLMNHAGNPSSFLEQSDKLAPHVEVHLGHADIAEGLSAMSSQGAVVQRMVEDVEMEFRVITSFDCTETRWFKRQRDNVPLKTDQNKFGYKQATGVALTPDGVIQMTPEEVVKIFPDALQVGKIAQQLGIGLNSMDVFVTKSGNWGIFEYCPQWGAVGMDPTMLRTFMKQQVVAMLDQQEENK